MAAGKNAWISERGSEQTGDNSKVKCFMACMLHHTSSYIKPEKIQWARRVICTVAFEIRPFGSSTNTWEI
jgi:hypothetical protein